MILKLDCRNIWRNKTRSLVIITAIALGIIEKIKSKTGINGIHLMSVGWEAIVPRIIADAGLN